MLYGYKNSTGGVSINSVTAFCDGLGNCDPLSLMSFEDVLLKCESLVRCEFSPASQAINNVRGNWYEWLFTIGFISFFKKNINLKPRFLLPLPNVKGFDVYQLYVPEVYKFIVDLRKKTEDRGVSLVSSNPDYAILEYDESFILPQISIIDSNLINVVDNTFKYFIGRCNFDQVYGFASVKTSLRPDRRLQLAHEGALSKAFYEHLKGRMWEINARGLKYYGCSMEAGSADHSALRTVATHSILSVNSKPEPAVDALFRVSNGKELNSFLSTILL